MMALRDWFKPRKSVPPKHRSRIRTRDVVIVNEVQAAEPPDTKLAEQSRNAQVGLVQSILNMERQASDLNKSLVELTLKNFSGGRS
jgi:hypothetical protein